MATNIATPMAIEAWRSMLIAPEPVANASGGKACVAVPINAGKISPTPMPLQVMPKTINAVLGSVPMNEAQMPKPIMMSAVPKVTG